MRWWKAFALPALAIVSLAQQKTAPTEGGDDLLWKKLESRIEAIDGRLDGAMGIAILDLTDGRLYTRNADQVFPTASSIKLAILLELYRQDQQARNGAPGNAKLIDVYTFDPKDLID